MRHWSNGRRPFQRKKGGVPKIMPGRGRNDFLVLMTIEEGRWPIFRESIETRLHRSPKRCGGGGIRLCRHKEYRRLRQGMDKELHRPWRQKKACRRCLSEQIKAKRSAAAESEQFRDLKKFVDWRKTQTGTKRG